MGPLRRSTSLLGITALAAVILWSGQRTDAVGGAPSCKDRWGPQEATIVGTDGDDVIHGTSGRDVIVAGAGDDTIFGGGYNDIICAGPGDDLIADGQWTARGGPGNDTIRGVMFQYGGDGADALEGTPANDVLVGGGGKDTLTGDTGHDNLVGGPGDDMISGGSGSDFIAADPGDDQIDGGARATNPNQGGFYILKCGDFLYWGSPQPEFDAEDIELQLEPGTKYRRGATVDLADGTAWSQATGRDTFASIESATGTAVGDVLRGTVEADCLYGYGGGDRIIGHGGDDALYSGKGADRIDAGGGDDDLWLETAQARVRGGAGHDWTFWWEAAVIDLASGVVRGGGFHGSIHGVEDVSGEYHRGPVIRGDALPNQLVGRRVYGRGGDDRLWGYFADGGPGNDACDASTQEHCESQIEVS